MCCHKIIKIASSIQNNVFINQPKNNDSKILYSIIMLRFSKRKVGKEEY